MQYSSAILCKSATLTLSQKQVLNRFLTDIKHVINPSSLGRRDDDTSWTGFFLLIWNSVLANVSVLKRIWGKGISDLTTLCSQRQTRTLRFSHFYTSTGRRQIWTTGLIDSLVRSYGECGPTFIQFPTRVRARRARKLVHGNYLFSGSTGDFWRLIMKSNEWRAKQPIWVMNSGFSPHITSYLLQLFGQSVKLPAATSLKCFIYPKFKYNDKTAEIMGMRN